MSESSGETSKTGSGSFALDSDPGKITSDQVKSYFNEGYMRGQVPAGEFIDTMLKLAGDVRFDALQLFALSLGHTNKSSGVSTNHTYEILNEGNENERTQGVVKALKPEHIKILRGLYTQKNHPLNSQEAYLLSLYHAPGIAEAEDVKVLCRDLVEGEPESLLNPKKEGVSTYYPEKILEVMLTSQKVLQERPDLVDASATAAIENLPERIKKSDLVIRLSYDRDITKEQLVEEAAKLQKIGKRLNEPQQ